MTNPKKPNPDEAKPSEASEPAKPEWLEKLNQLMDRIDPKDTERAMKDMAEFVEGNKTWAEVQGIPQAMLLDIAEQGYLKFKSGRFKEAEDLFKGLCVIDHRTAYYHTALGAIYQKQQKTLDALAEYTCAIEMDPNDITAYVNRGEIFFNCGYLDDAPKDFEKAITLDPEGKDPWANRARHLKNKYIAKWGQP